MKNVKLISNNRLCIGCGICVDLCPQNAISLYRNDNIGNYDIFVNNEKCKKCNLCLNLCPSLSIDLRKKNPSKNYNYFIGNYTDCYIGNSLNDKIWKYSASGGLVTELLISLLEEKIIDGAVVSKFNAKNPLEPKAIIAKTKREILSSSGSIYCPVSFNNTIKTIIENKGKYAFVGLPCHIQAINKAQNILPILKKRILYLFGLFCSKTPTFKATEYLLHKLAIPKLEVKKITYRRRGHPGKLEIIKKDNNKINIRLKSRLYYGHNFDKYFYSIRCWICPDKTAELADISFGDNWDSLSRLSNPKATSMIISRSKKGSSLLKKLEKQKKISIKKIKEEDVLKSQNLHYKKKTGPKLYLLKIIKRKIPNFQPKMYRYSLIDLLLTLPDFFRVLFTEKKRNHILRESFFLIDWIICSIFKYIKLLLFSISNPKLTIKYLRNLKLYLKQKFK